MAKNRTSIPNSPADQLRALLAKPEMMVISACYDALTAKQIETAGMPATFMSGFAVAATRLALPDTGLITYGEMVEQGRNICNATSIPVIGDGDTGYGNALNVKRTVQGYDQAGFACVMIEDQVAPKRCGHTRGKLVVDRDEATGRIQAAVDARDGGADVLIMARTDARAVHGIEESIARARDFAEIGADILFVEAPESAEELARIGEQVPGPKLANLVEGGDTPLLASEDLEALGFKIAAFPVTLLSASVRAMQEALTALADGRTPERLLDWKELRRVVGFDAYEEALARYRLLHRTGTLLAAVR